MRRLTRLVVAIFVAATALAAWPRCAPATGPSLQAAPTSAPAACCSGQCCCAAKPAVHRCPQGGGQEDTGVRSALPGGAFDPAPLLHFIGTLHPAAVQLPAASNLRLVDAGLGSAEMPAIDRSLDLVLALQI